MGKKLFRYYTYLRPTMPGAIPKCTYCIHGFDERKYVDDAGCKVWGWVDCERELTPDEVSEYELVKGRSDA